MKIDQKINPINKGLMYQDLPYRINFKYDHADVYIGLANKDKLKFSFKKFLIESDNGFQGRVELETDKRLKFYLINEGLLVNF